MRKSDQTTRNKEPRLKKGINNRLEETQIKEGIEGETHKFHLKEGSSIIIFLGVIKEGVTRVCLVQKIEKLRNWVDKNNNKRVKKDDK